MKLGEGGLREQAEGKGVSYLRVTEHLLQLSQQTPARQTPAASGDTSRAEPSVCSCLGRGSDRKEGVVLAPR